MEIAQIHISDISHVTPFSKNDSVQFIIGLPCVCVCVCVCVWYDCNPRYTVFWLMELHDHRFPNVPISDVDAEDFERPRTTVGADVVITKTPDHPFQIWWEFQMSSPQAVRFFQAYE
jgi:hypothetical protein